VWFRLLFIACVGMASTDFRIVTVAVALGWGWASQMAARLTL